MRKSLLSVLVAIGCVLFTTPAQANLLTQGTFSGATVTSSAFNPGSATPLINQWLGINQWQIVTDTNGYDSPASNTYAKHLSNGKVRLFQGIDTTSLETGEYRISFYYVYQTGFATNEDPYVWVLGVNTADPSISQFPGPGDGFPTGGTPSPISNWDVLFQKKLAGTCPFAGCDIGPSLPVPWTLVDETFDLSTSYDFLVIVFSFGAFGTNATGLRGIDDVVLERNVIEVGFDVKPGGCPNPLNVKSQGVLPTAILGTDSFDVTTVDPSTIQLEGVSPLRWAVADVATPFADEKEDCMDCNDLYADGYADLVLNFDSQELAAVLGEVCDGECLILTLTGSLAAEYNCTPIQGEDVLLILKKEE